MSPVRFLVAPLLKQSECSAVGSALRSGRRGRAFESPHSDKEDGSCLTYPLSSFSGAPTPAVEYDEIDSEDIDEGND